ncbi:MAG: sigma 54-interacting transcriptional regulator [Gemmatimonadota bacterium]|nr:sigma 54-interacting transcriptional regulator [Gemmatimonadota bacterium]
MERTDGRADGRAVGQTVGRSDGRTVGRSDGRTVGRSDGRTDGPTIIAVSSVMRRAVELARRLAPSASPVLLVGATGTGKEVLAQSIHYWSGRAGPMVDLDCGAVPSSMAVNQLFGHVRGAYTGAADSAKGLVASADRGTLFLDELTNLSRRGQAALLRVIETGEVRPLGGIQKQPVDFRLVAAVQDSVWAARESGRLREDLFQRLATWVIRLPPLAERPDDLVHLAEYFAALKGRRLVAGATAILEAYAWPGNVRELRGVIDRACFLARDHELGPAALAEALALGADGRTVGRSGGRTGGRSDGRAGGRSDGRAGGQQTRGDGEQAERDGERERIVDLCRRFDGDPGLIAAALGLSRATLYRRLRKLSLTLHQCLTGPDALPSHPSQGE